MSVLHDKSMWMAESPGQLSCTIDMEINTYNYILWRLITLVQVLIALLQVLYIEKGTACYEEIINPATLTFFKFNI